IKRKCVPEYRSLFRLRRRPPDAEYRSHLQHILLLGEYEYPVSRLYHGRPPRDERRVAPSDQHQERALGKPELYHLFSDGRRLRRYGELHPLRVLVVRELEVGA